jgi:predicted nucleotidyltransferase
MFERLLRKIASQLRKSDLPYMIIGGQAVLLYGTPRLTNDIDVTLGVDIAAIDRVAETIRRIGLAIIPEDFGSFVEKTYVLPTKDEKTGIRVDFIFSFTQYENQAISRSKPVLIGSVRVMFASVEDVIIHKVFAGRPRDLEDVRSMMLKNPGLDKAYVRRWLEEFEGAPEKRGLLKAFEDASTE